MSPERLVLLPDTAQAGCLIATGGSDCHVAEIDNRRLTPYTHRCFVGFVPRALQLAPKLRRMLAVLDEASDLRH